MSHRNKWSIVWLFSLFNILMNFINHLIPILMYEFGLQIVFEEFFLILLGINDYFLYPINLQSSHILGYINYILYHLSY